MRDPDYEDLTSGKSVWDWIPTLIAFLAIYAVLFVFYRPNLLFSLTTTGGWGHRRLPLPHAGPHSGSAPAFQAHRLGSWLVRGHAHVHLLLPLPLPC